MLFFAARFSGNCPPFFSKVLSFLAFSRGFSGTNFGQTLAIVWSGVGGGILV